MLIKKIKVKHKYFETSFVHFVQEAHFYIVIKSHLVNLANGNLF